jgi:hypothetical protein
MFKINEDGSIYVTRGDTCTISVVAKVNGEPHLFKAGDVLRIKVYERKACHCVVLQKDFAVLAETDTVDLTLTERDTRIGDLINKPVDYWYEIELNPLTAPQTIVGYDDDGAKAFRLFPEAADHEVIDPPEPEEIPVVDPELDLLSTRPVENQAVTRAILEVKEASEKGIQQNAEEIAKNAEAIQQNTGLIDEHKEDKNNPHGVTKEQLGLDNVDNTSDAQKPVSVKQAEAIYNVETRVADHERSKENPHGVTADQIGLGNVNNTSDMDKPVSTAQAEAIADAKKAGEDAQTVADEAKTAAGNAQNTADEAKSAADNAQTAADSAQASANEAKAAAEAAQTMANGMTTWFTEYVTLKQDMFRGSGARMTVTVNGVTREPDQPIFITPYDDDMEEYDFCGIKAISQEENGITFACEKALSKDISLKIVGLTVPAGEV